MVRRVLVENICDGCGLKQNEKAQKHWLGFIKKPRLLTGWKVVREKEFCPACYEIYLVRDSEMWNKLLEELKHRLLGLHSQTKENKK